jgi:hypothetical protein
MFFASFVCCSRSLRLFVLDDMMGLLQIRSKVEMLSEKDDEVKRKVGGQAEDRQQQVVIALAQIRRRGQAQE